jgi:hypothetical protein
MQKRHCPGRKVERKEKEKRMKGKVVCRKARVFRKSRDLIACTSHQPKKKLGKQVYSQHMLARMLMFADVCNT